MFHKNKLLKKLNCFKGFWRSSRVSTLPNLRIDSCTKGGFEIEWELRPGGMLVQKRVMTFGHKESMITLKVSIGSTCYDIPIQATSTFGELKAMLTKVTSLEEKEQRLIYKGKERNDTEHLHMVGVSDKDRILLLHDPARKSMKLNAIPSHGTYPAINGLRRSITVDF